MTDIKKKKTFVILRGVVNDGRTRTALPKPVTPENLQQVWTVYDEAKFNQFPFHHLHGSFLEDRMHDWDLTRTGELRFYGHSGARGDKHDLALVYEDT